MTVHTSATVANAALDARETAIGAAPLLRHYTGSAPANCATAASGTLLAELTLPSDWMAAASAGTKTKSGTWAGTVTAAGAPGYYRIYDSTGTTCHLQGSVTVTGGGGDMTVNNTAYAINDTLTVTSYSWSEATYA